MFLSLLFILDQSFNLTFYSISFSGAFQDSSSLIESLLRNDRLADRLPDRSSDKNTSTLAKSKSKNSVISFSHLEISEDIPKIDNLITEFQKRGSKQDSTEGYSPFPSYGKRKVPIQQQYDEGIVNKHSSGYMILAPTPSDGEPWPYPKRRRLLKAFSVLSRNVTIEFPERTCDVLTHNVARFERICSEYADTLHLDQIPREREKPAGKISSIRIRTSCRDEKEEEEEKKILPHIDMDESCKYGVSNYKC